VRAAFQIAMVFLAMFYSFNLLAQEEEDRVERYDDKFSIGTFYALREFKYFLVPTIDGVLRNDLTIEMQPNARRLVGGSFLFGNIGLRISSKLPEEERDVDRYGKGKSLEFNVSLYGKKNIIETSFARFDGLADVRISKYEDDPDPTISPYVRSDMVMTAFNVNFMHIFNYKRYSYRSSFYFNERQVNSGGSLLLIGNASLLSTKADSSWIMVGDSVYLQKALHNKSEVRSIGPGLGYAYNLVLNNHFIGVLANVVPQWQWIETENTQTKASKTLSYIQPHYSFRASGGFNKRVWYLVLVLQYNFNEYGSTLGRNYVVRSDISMNVGIRIDEPRTINRIKKELRLN
jgi:hypothetical protein